MWLHSSPHSRRHPHAVRPPNAPSWTSCWRCRNRAARPRSRRPRPTARPSSAGSRPQSASNPKSSPACRTWCGWQRTSKTRYARTCARRSDISGGYVPAKWSPRSPPASATWPQTSPIPAAIRPMDGSWAIYWPTCCPSGARSCWRARRNTHGNAWSAVCIFPATWALASAARPG